LVAVLYRGMVRQAAPQVVAVAAGRDTLVQAAVVAPVARAWCASCVGNGLAMIEGPEADLDALADEIKTGRPG